MTEIKSRKSRLPRTGTLVLIAVVLLVAYAFLAVWLPYHRNQAAIAEIQRLGGHSESVIVRPSWIPDAVDIPDALAEEHLWVYSRVSTVDLSYTAISDAGLEFLQGLDSIDILVLNDTQVGNAGLEHLRVLTTLRGLLVANTQVTDAGLEHLRGLSDLHWLSLDNTTVTDAGLEHLRGLTNLSYLRLSNTQVSDAGFEHLRGLTNLSYLTLRDNQVTHAGIANLQKALPNCNVQWAPPVE